MTFFLMAIAAITGIIRQSMFSWNSSKRVRAWSPLRKIMPRQTVEMHSLKDANYFEKYLNWPANIVQYSYPHVRNRIITPYWQIGTTSNLAENMRFLLSGTWSLWSGMIVSFQNYIKHFYVGITWNKAGYAATQVACGWAGAVMNKADQGFGFRS